MCGLELSLMKPANGGHNPVAEVDFDVTKRATGDLGSWLGSARFWVPLLYAVGYSDFTLGVRTIVTIIASATKPTR